MDDLIVFVSFGIRGKSLNTDYISSVVGIQPSHAFKRGDEFCVKSTVYQRPFGVWQLRSTPVIESSSVSDHALYALSVIEPAIGKIGSYIYSDEFYVDVRIWWERPSDVGSFTLPSVLVARLANICNEFNLSFIALAPSIEEDFNHTD